MYMTRATYLTFFGEPRGAAAGEHHDDEHDNHPEEHELVGAHSLSAAANAHDHGDHAHGDHGHGDDGHDDHGHDDHGPHESGKLILFPIVVLAFLATVSGFSNATPLGESWEQFKKYVEPRPEAVAYDAIIATGPGESMQLVVPAVAPSVEDSGGEGGGKATGCGRSEPEPGTACFFPAVVHAEPKFAKILLSLAVVAAGYAAAIGFCIAFYKKRDPRLVGLTRRSRLARGGYLFLSNKYYLDHLYEKVIVRGVAHPIAKGAYWINQNVLDGAVNGVGAGGKRAGNWIYDNVDQKVVDGAVNGSGFVASESGHAMQPMQSGKVNQYGALIFGAAAVGAIVLVILNAS
jgi:NADH-quinone oxidoreductase subunit L